MCKRRSVTTDPFERHASRRTIVSGSTFLLDRQSLHQPLLHLRAVDVKPTTSHRWGGVNPHNTTTPWNKPLELGGGGERRGLSGSDTCIRPPLHNRKPWCLLSLPTISWMLPTERLTQPTLSSFVLSQCATPVEDFDNRTSISSAWDNTRGGSRRLSSWTMCNIPAMSEYAESTAQKNSATDLGYFTCSVTSGILLCSSIESTTLGIARSNRHSSNPSGTWYTTHGPEQKINLLEALNDPCTSMERAFFCVCVCSSH